jgi:transposase
VLDELLEERTLPYDEDAVERMLGRWPAVRCCYEAGPTGGALLLRGRPGRLRSLSASGRVWDRVCGDRQRLSKFCLRQGRLLPTSAWTVIRRKWLGEQRFEHAAEQITFDSYLHAVDLVDRRIEMLERAIRETAAQGPWRELVARLRCLRGIDTLTALALVAEIGDFSRFRSAEELMAFVGLVPCEHSSGEHRRQGSITRVGNSHVRRLLVEAAWHARRRPKVGYELARRQRGQDALVVERSWRCQQRLFQRWQRMAARGKPHQKIVVACARELAGFVWAIATEQPLRSA